MKKCLCMLLAGALVFLLTACHRNQQDNPASDKILLSILHNSKPFITEQNETVFLKDYRIKDYNNIAIAPEKYAFIDFDKDGTNELIVYGSPDYGAYMIFRYNIKNVYGYFFNSRALISLKEDGTFMQSEGAGINTYAKLSFDKNGYIIIKEAMTNTLEGLYKINEEIVAYERIKEFIDKWDAKNSISWTMVN